MALEHLRERVFSTPDPEYFYDKQAAGWRLTAIEWERDAQPQPHPTAPAFVEETPFGLEVAPDCLHLVDMPAEKQALSRIMELIVEDRPLSQVAVELNLQGFRTRQGAPWSAPALFELLPRLIEAGPRIFSDDEYIARKHRRAQT